MSSRISSWPQSIRGFASIKMHQLTALRRSASAAWAAPFFIFLGLGMLIPLCESDIAGMPWYRHSPAQWVYPLQTLAGLAAVAFWWSHYRFRPLTGRMIALAALTAALGIGLWILPSWAFLRGLVPEIKWLGCTSRTDGFDPTLWGEGTGTWALAIAARFVRMVICVALVEELLWRGFVWRSLTAEYHEFWQEPFAARSAKAFLIVTGLIVVAHAPVDYAGALLWAVLTNLLYLKTRSVGALVVCHAIANLLLGLYIMQSRQWGLW
jgi:uncharacterized protein